MEGRGRRGSLGLKSTERFERTFLAASSCKPFPITKFPIRPFSVQFLTLITAVLLAPGCFSFSAAKANERPGVRKKEANDSEKILR